MLFLINGIITLIISVYLIYKIIKNRENSDIKRIINYFWIIAFCYALISAFLLLWQFGILNYNESDFRIIYSTAIIVQTLVLFRLNYAISKNTTYLLLFYIMVPLSISISITYLPSLALITSFLLGLIFSLNIVFLTSSFKRAGYAGIFYSLISVLLEFLLLFKIGGPFNFSIFSNLLFLIFISILLTNIEKNPARFQPQLKIKKEPYVLLFAKYFIFIIAITNLVLIGTVGIHEFSHVFVSRVYGCESRSVIYEKGIYPYTEIVCDDLSGQIPIALSGPLIPIILGAVLFFIGGRFIKSISLLMIGFNLVASYKDLQDIGVSTNLTLVSTIVGIFFLLLGVILLAKSRVEEDHPMHLNVRRNIDFNQRGTNKQ
jgi:hypothetical protein